ncbi:MAG: plasmid stabilization protein [Methylibium sp. NZG]|nr:MAG: plasmid stabilization protein [Methylibium sp. NZG]
MSGDFTVRYTAIARDDLDRLFEHLLGRAETVDDFDAAQLAVETIRAEVEGRLSRTPFIYRKVGQSPFLRELITPFRGLGYVALYEIEGASIVNIVAVRHQLEADYH